MQEKPNDNSKHLGKWEKTRQTNFMVNDPYDTKLC